MIEVLVGDENVIVDWFRGLQIIVEEVRIEGNIHITQDDLKSAAAPPPHEYVFHGVFPAPKFPKVGVPLYQPRGVISTV